MMRQRQLTEVWLEKKCIFIQEATDVNGVKIHVSSVYLYNLGSIQPDEELAADSIDTWH